MRKPNNTNMIEKVSSWDNYLSQVDEDTAKALYSYFKEVKEIDKEHPIMSKLKLSPIGNKLRLMQARQLAYRSQLEGKENVKMIIPFIGVGRRGQRELDKIAAWTEHGAKKQKAFADHNYDLAKIYDESERKYPGKELLWGNHSRSLGHTLAARQLEAKSQLEGKAKIKNLVPFYGIRGKQSKEDVEVKKLTKAQKQYLLATTAGIGLSAGASMSLMSDMKKLDLIPEKGRKSYEGQSNNVIKYFKNRGTSPGAMDVSFDNPAIMSHFNPRGKGKIYSNPITPDILAHELGHADNLRQYQKVLGNKGGKAALYSSLPLEAWLGKYRDAINLGSVGKLSPVGMLAAAPMLSDTLTDKIKTKNPGKWNKVVETVQDRPEIAVGVATAPLLVEEGRATAKALKALKEVAPETVTQSRKRLGKAYGTYLGFSMLPVAAASLWGHHKRNKKETEKQGAFTPYRKGEESYSSAEAYGKEVANRSMSTLLGTIPGVTIAGIGSTILGKKIWDEVKTEVKGREINYNDVFDGIKRYKIKNPKAFIVAPAVVGAGAAVGAIGAVTSDIASLNRTRAQYGVEPIKTKEYAGRVIPSAISAAFIPRVGPAVAIPVDYAAREITYSNMKRKNKNG